MPPVILPVKQFQQPRSGECLAACVAMVLNYINVSFTYRHLVSLLEIIPEIGTASYNVRNLERMGLAVSYQQGTFDRLYQHLLDDEPCIAFVQTNELPYRNNSTEHAVVVVGLDNAGIYLNDPEADRAPIRVPRGDFDLAWLARDEKYAVIVR